MSLNTEAGFSEAELNFEQFTSALTILMDADKKAQIQAHARAIAALLYEETDPEQVKTLLQALKKRCGDIF